MKVGVLTSSRADYGIYTPLLKKMSAEVSFDLELIAFGMHLLRSQGYTIREIEKDAFGVIHRVAGMPDNDRKIDIASGYGELIKQFAQFWYGNDFDCVLALGDRWEMSAAVQASLPYEVKIAHIHGGETTLGAIDNIYRHQISLASTFHFTAAEPFSKRVKEIIAHDKHVYTVGSISLEDLSKLNLPTWNQVKEEFEIPFDDFVLVTIHPESVKSDQNRALGNIVFTALVKLAKSNNILITNSNSDVMGSIFNEKFRNLQERCPTKIKLLASLGKLNYFRAMYQCDLLLGNSSSGIVEAASFNKWAINIGDRQKGRLRNENVIDIPFDIDAISKTVQTLKKRGPFTGLNRYIQSDTTSRIINILAGA